MSFKKAILHGKTRRKPYRSPNGRRYTFWCNCGWCINKWFRAQRKKLQRKLDSTNDSLRDYEDSQKIQHKVGKHRLSLREREERLARWRQQYADDITNSIFYEEENNV